MQEVPISNESISDVVWAALELSDRCNGGTDIDIEILPSGAVILNIFLQGYNKSAEYRQYRIHSDEDAKKALKMLEEVESVRKPREKKVTVKDRLKMWAYNKLLLFAARLGHIREAIRGERAEWILLKREARKA